MEPLLSLTTIARQLDVSERRVLRWLRAGQFPEPVALPDGGRVWRASSVAAWVAELPTSGLREATPSPSPEESASLERQPSGLAARIVRVLTDAKGLWMSGEEIAAALGGSILHTSGYFKRTIKTLRDRGVVESDKMQGYRIAGPHEGQT